MKKGKSLRARYLNFGIYLRKNWVLRILFIYPQWVDKYGIPLEIGVRFWWNGFVIQFLYLGIQLMLIHED